MKRGREGLRRRGEGREGGSEGKSTFWDNPHGSI
jgi:hypothetical protein